MENNRVLLISSLEKIIILFPTVEDEKKYPGALVLRGDYKINFKDNKLEKLENFIKERMELCSLEESLILQPVLNRIYTLKKFIL